MIYSLRGKLIYIDNSAAVVECSGVGYNCNITLCTYNDLKGCLEQEVVVFTHLNVREDCITLLGFSQKTELDCFKLLTSVSGVGAKVGITILSALAPEQIIMAISSENTKILTCAPGVGNKLAQRIILELKDKVAKMQETSLNNVFAIHNAPAINENAQKASEALAALGYSPADIQKTLLGLDTSLSVEELIKSSLKIIARRS